MVLDAKYGKGSFQSTLEEAKALAESLIHTGEANGLSPTTTFLTHMDQPIGAAIGNWLEVRECLDIMRGEFNEITRDDLVTLVVVQSAQMLYQSTNNTESLESLMQKAVKKLRDGTALAQFRRMVVAQGGDPAVIDDPDQYPLTAKKTANVCATTTGYICEMNALVVGQVSVMLGAGRRVSEDTVDPTAGILLKSKVGHFVQQGDCIAQLFGSCDDDDIMKAAVNSFQSCLKYQAEPVTVPPIISHILTSEKGMKAFEIPNFWLD